ncbi:HAMP domain-containing histidine kinase [Phycicoccus endophyticus]|uniref:histidine kinase n=2 Tax=Phycicoccus endophyticus TaxID=1690220 RepID=A0A7G9R0I3_9MICO|nr:HAMP domain-containing sensor histidine kinase [Phycicoccus endophyticus]QNN49108.1 HAMP domain-containing histidine kinase [Phycicoccus endophyticus]
MSASGQLTTVVAPDSDPELVPAVAAGEQIAEPQGRPTTSGRAHRVRVVTTTLGMGGTQAVIAVPTTSADAATRRLAATLSVAGLGVAGFVGLLLWWVDRLGLRPIAQMTRAADAITAGDPGAHVPPGPPGTEAARLGEALTTMVATTQATNERMRRFVADASHELRTPLTTVGGYAALHAGRSPGPLDEEGRAEVDDAMRRIGQEAARMRRLVDGLLDLTGLESPDALRREAVDLAEVLHDVVSDLRVVAPDRTVTLEAPESLLVTADRDRVTQALVGLTSNAVRHTPGGTPVALRVLVRPGWVRVEVSDAGPGIPPEHLPHVLERFYRVDRSRSSGSGGSGLGLAVVDAVARAHGGRVTVDSPPGAGTTVGLELPR